jgi:hypothetical protein
VLSYAPAVQCNGKAASQTTLSSGLIIPDSVQNAGTWYKVTKIAASAFKGTSSSPNTQIVSVTIPNTVDTILGNAFEYCPNIKKIVLGEGIKRISTYAFSESIADTVICYALTPPSLGSLPFSTQCARLFVRGISKAAYTASTWVTGYFYNATIYDIWKTTLHSSNRALGNVLSLDNDLSAADMDSLTYFIGSTIYPISVDALYPNYYYTFNYNGVLTVALPKPGASFNGWTIHVTHATGDSTITNWTPNPLLAILQAADWDITANFSAATTIHDTIYIDTCDNGISGIMGENSDVNLYPNPATSSVSIESSDNIDRIIVNDLTGREIISQIINGRKAEVDMNGLPKGSYLFRIIGNDRFISTKKVIKQ